MPNPTLIVSWPQAAVALGIIVALSIVPSILGWLNTRALRGSTHRLEGSARRAAHSARRVEDTLTTNNGGGHVKDSLDRIERALARLGDRVTRLEQQQRRPWWRVLSGRGD